ncbi:MAG: phosphoribosyltransferase family protein [Gelidibacter sp.]
MQKVRHGDRDVEVSVPDVDKYKDATPILVDDIISTARTMIETVQHLKKAGMKPLYVWVFTQFFQNAYQDLLDSGWKK